MQPAYTITRITPEQVDAASLLAGLLVPVLDIEIWRCYCGLALSGRPAPDGRRHEIVVARAPDGHLRGLCVHRPVVHIVHGTILDTPVFVVASAADARGVADALLQHLCAVVERLDCAALRLPAGCAERWLGHADARAAIDRRYRLPLILDAATPFEVPWASAQCDGLPVNT